MAKIGKVTKVNPVAKHSRNKSGAGAHKSAKDFKRQAKHKNLEKIGYYEYEEQEDWDMLPDPEVFDKHIEEQNRLQESVASKLDRLILLQNMQEHCNNPSIWFSYEEEIIQIKEELENVDF